MNSFYLNKFYDNEKISISYKDNIKLYSVNAIVCVWNDNEMTKRYDDVNNYDADHNDHN